VFGARPADVVSLGGKVKARCGIVRYVGDWHGATNFVAAGQMAYVYQAAQGSAANTGYRSSAANTGDRSSAANTGDGSSAVVTGLDGRARGGPFSALALAWWNKEAKRTEMRAAEIGIGDGSDGKLKRDVWYRLDAAGQFVEVQP
jgi:hypothetical protein